MGQKDTDVRIDRLNIQRAQSAVLVEHEGVEYAIVSDDNYHHLDPYWRALYEAPMFVSLGAESPPLAIGGSASAKRVAVGGKLGIIKDPFGIDGTPQFIGATLPLDGYGIVNLSLSEDGQVLIGQLKGGISANLADPLVKPHANLAWRVSALIQAALSNPQPKTKHISLAPADAPQSIPVWQATDGGGTSYTAAPAGTAFDPETRLLQLDGRMGDVIEIDLRDMLARSWLELPATGPIEWTVGSRYENQKDKFDDFKLELGELELLTIDPNDGAEAQPQLFTLTSDDTTDPNRKNQPLSRDASLNRASFGASGRMYLVPNITSADMLRLRNGQTLADKSVKSISFSYTTKGDDGDKVYHSSTISVTAKDYARAANTFFGDRPLDNPGYSKFVLKGAVTTGTTDQLDVLKVEQRLKYLGYSSFEKTRDNIVKEFKVDGKFETTEATALRGFYSATHYTQWAYGGGGAGYEATDPKGKSDAAKEASRVISTADIANNDNFNWLNAYNAPHWMDIYEALPVPRTMNQPSNKFSNGAGNIEAFGTSWVHDLMQRWRAVQSAFESKTAEQKALLLTSDHIKVNGLTSPSGYSATGQHEIGGHSTGMSLDLGFATNYITVPQTHNKKENDQTPPAMTGSNGWSYANAVAWSGLITDTKNRGEKHALRNFLSLYSLTVSDSDATNSNGTWEELQLANGDEAKRALFGDGTQAQSMIQHVFVGDAPKKGETTANYNSFPLIRAVVGKLEIPVGPANDHEHHFHVDFRTPTRRALNTTSNLLAESPEILDETPTATNDTEVNTPLWITEARADFAKQIGEFDMLIMDATPYSETNVIKLSRCVVQ